MALLTMSQKELDRYGILKKVLARELNGVRAAHLLRLSVRQVRQLKRRVREGGAQGLIHCRRGTPGNRRLPENERACIVALLSKRYADFGPTFACEKLRERHGSIRDPKTIRALMIREGLWRRRKPTAAVHRAWRARKEHPGELVQFDGSYERWFEDRGPTTCLLAAIDDATGNILKAEFAAHEGVIPVFAFWKGYVTQHGKPRAIYPDKFSTYRQNRPKGEEDCDLKTRFQRAMREMGIEPVFANSPQAKGRVERPFKALQDRLIKELRLRGISGPEDANRFLRETFIRDHNRRFGVAPVAGSDPHRPLTAREHASLDAVFARQEERIVRNDFTVSFKNAWYQILPTPRIALRPKDAVIVEERPDGSLKLRIRNAYLHFKDLPSRPQRQRMPWVRAAIPGSQRASWQPSADHPWRRIPVTVSAPLK